MSSASSDCFNGLALNNAAQGATSKRQTRQHNGMSDSSTGSQLLKAYKEKHLLQYPSMKRYKAMIQNDAQEEDFPRSKRQKFVSGKSISSNNVGSLNATCEVGAETASGGNVFVDFSPIATSDVSVCQKPTRTQCLPIQTSNTEFSVCQCKQKTYAILYIIQIFKNRLNSFFCEKSSDLKGSTFLL